MNTKVRLLIRRAYGFHSADAALALVMLAAGPIELKLPHERVIWKAAALIHIVVRRAGCCGQVMTNRGQMGFEAPATTLLTCIFLVSERGLLTVTPRAPATGMFPVVA